MTKPFGLKILQKLNKNGKRILHSQCWEWQGSTRGYPMKYPAIRLNGKTLGVSRVLWNKKYGKIPDKMCILHKCDNPSCIRLSHLFLGTNYDNVQDRHKKGRSRGGINKGENSPLAKLSNQQVNEIRQLYSTRKISQYTLANMFNISQTHVSEIINYKVRI